MNYKLQTIDKLALSLIFALSLVIGGLILLPSSCGTDCFFQTGPKVKEFSWQNQQIGTEDRSFILTFDRPMDRVSVEKNLVIEPSLPGKISWAGRRLAYTLTTPVSYGEVYKINLQGAKEGFRTDAEGELIQPFVGQFKSRDRAFAYIGIQPSEQGQLILYNLTQQKQTILTPPNLTVFNFKFYPKGDKILFSAAAKEKGNLGIRELQLYTVSTRINGDSQSASTAKIELILDSKEYQNNQFDLSTDGETIVVQRVNRNNLSDFDLWRVKKGIKPERLNILGGEFMIAPDGQTLAVSQGEGIGLLPLEIDTEPLDFLPKFGQVLSFSVDGSAAAMINFNTDNAKLRYTRSLYYVNNQGLKKELFNTQGSIIDCQFAPTGDQLYCLLTQLLEEKDYQEKPYLAKINIKTSQVTPLLELPDYREVKMSLSPDGLAILFDQVVTSETTTPTDTLTTDSGETIVNSRLWLLIPPVDNNPELSKPVLEELPLTGIRPQWAP